MIGAVRAEIRRVRGADSIAVLISPLALTDLQRSLVESGHDVVRTIDRPADVRESLRLLADLADDAIPTDVIGVGEWATPLWEALASGRMRTRSMVMIAVPGVKNLDFNRGPRVPVLALHSQQDRLVMTTHPAVHRAMAFGQEPHQMIEYDQVHARFWDRSSPDWDAPTAADAFDRAAHWGTKSVGYRVRS